MVGKKELIRAGEGTTLAPWSPFRDLRRQMRNMMSGVLEDFLSGDAVEAPLDLLGARAWAPAVDVEETEKEYIFEVELPGMSRQDFKVEMQNGALCISGERKAETEEKGKTFLRHEQYYGRFQRMFSLPQDANQDAIKASYKHGILTVTVARLQNAKPKAIAVAGD